MAKRTGKKKTSKKPAGRGWPRGGPRRKKAEQPTLSLGKITIPGGRLSEQATARVLGIIAKKRELDTEVVELKKKRDLVRQDFNGDEKEIESMADAGAPADAALAIDFLDKVVGLLRDRAKRKKKYKELGVKIGECNATLKGLFDEMAQIIAKEDPEGTLYAAFGIENPADTPVDEGEGLGSIDDEGDETDDE